MVQYSPICDVSVVAYLFYLAAVTGRNVEDLCGSNRILVGGGGCDSGSDAIGDLGCLLRQVRVGELSPNGLAPLEVRAGQEPGVDRVETVLSSTEEQPVKVETECGAEGRVRGKWSVANKKKAERKKKKKKMEQSWRRKDEGACGVEDAPTCASGSSVTAVEEAEMEARRTLALRRTAENHVAAAKAKLLSASLSDESMVAAYNELKKQRLVQRRNDSQARSQASLNKCKSIDPGSSASQYDLRQQAKKLLDTEAQCELLSVRLNQVCGLLTKEQRLEYDTIKVVSPATEQRIWDEGQMWLGSDVGSEVMGY